MWIICLIHIKYQNKGPILDRFSSVWLKRFKEKTWYLISFDDDDLEFYIPFNIG